MDENSGARQGGSSKPSRIVIRNLGRSRGLLGHIAFFRLLTHIMPTRASYTNDGADGASEAPGSLLCAEYTEIMPKCLDSMVYGSAALSSTCASTKLSSVVVNRHQNFHFIEARAFVFPAQLTSKCLM